MSRFDFTLARSAEHGKIAAKRIVGKDDGSRVVFAYDRISRWFFAARTAPDLDGMAEQLRSLAEWPDLMVVMGAPRPGLDLRRAQLRRWADADAAKNTLVDVPRSWLAIDVDGYGVPAPFGRAEHLADAAAAVRDDALGEDFADVACVVAATASTGLAGEDVAKCRLFFLLDRAHPIADLHRWARGAQVAGLPVDPAVMQAGQPIYTARPIFRGRLSDPVPPALRAFVLPGNGDRVILDVHRYDAPAAEAERRTVALEHACGGDWRLLLGEALGRPEGRGATFFAPLTTALGIAARTGEDEAGIIAWTQQLLGQRADPGRLRQYGPQWCATTIRRFRQRDKAAHTDVEQLRARVFGA